VPSGIRVFNQVRVSSSNCNFLEHALESKMAIPEVPTIFAKFPNVAIGCHKPIVLPKNSTQPDYEAEMAFVIGKRGRHIPAGNGRNTCSAIQIQRRERARFPDAHFAVDDLKTFDTFAPMGPAIVTADEVPDPHALDISTTIGGEVLQHSNTNDLIFKIPELIAYLSSVFTLEPGDVIATGTPSGDR
jgi:2-keto-4-pentenoate hydratase/2-oxohepta-3-ene-1,7-dioic acid hydratase in catechol pathway